MYNKAETKREMENSEKLKEKAQNVKGTKKMRF
jgi:hypothetical protein